MKFAFKPSLSVLAIIVIVLFCIVTANMTKVWCGDTPFCYDVKQYYSYLPKFFLEHDLDFNNRGGYWLNFLPNGKPVMKYSCGLSILIAPFFLLAWLFSNVFGLPIEGGYSKIFIEFIHYGVFIYFLIGLICLRKVLKHFQLSEIVITITLLVLFFGTNLFYYISGKGLMTHGFLFSLHSVFLYLIIKFYKNPSFIVSLFLGFIGGLIALIRPTEVVCFLVWILWDINSVKSFKQRVMLLFSNYKFVLAIIAMFVVVWIPQMLYWNHLSGHLFLYSYSNERLFFDDPKIFQVLFSTRNGLIPYSPVILFFLLAIFIPKSKVKWKLEIFIFVILNIYLVSCWWCWWYGGSFGMRALIQLYPYLAIPFAGMLEAIYQSEIKYKNVLKYSSNAIIFLLVLFSIKLTYQAKYNVVHHDSMTRKAYWFIFPKMLLNEQEIVKFYTLLDPPDYDKAMKGIR